MDPVLEGFQTINDSFESLYDNCFLKSKSQDFMPYTVSLQGNEIYFFRRQTDKTHKYMHSLTSCYLKSSSDNLTDSID
jgi:hypothetical protein